MIYVTGDVHGDVSRFRAAARRLKKGDVLVVCGDFGLLWDGSKKEQRRLRRLARRRYTVAFLDGQHENYDLLAAYPEAEWNGGRVQQLAPNIVHLLRGELYTIEGKRCFAFGGGESESPEWRTQAGAGWEQAVPTEEQLRGGMQTLERAGFAVDYVFTHEPSARVRTFFGPAADLTDGLGLYFNWVEQHTTFRHWYFGCIHKDKQLSRKYTALFLQIRPVEDAP